MASEVTVRGGRDPGAVDRILRSLPDWFGIEEAIVEYVADSQTAESYLAMRDGEVVGVALVQERFPRAAELNLIAVHADHRQSGAGSALVEAVASSLLGRGFALLEVHTVGASYEHDGYAATRAFYERVGFIPLHEFEGIDWDGPTLVLVRPLSNPVAR